MEAHQIVGQVHEAFPKVPDRLALLFGKTAELFRSHHREPKSRNPSQSGNTSPVTHYIEYVHRYEAAVPGAGRMLSNRVHASLTAEFDDEDILTEVEHFETIADESLDVKKWLAKYKFRDATPNQLVSLEREIGEAIDALQDALGDARHTRRLKEAGIPMRNGRLN